MGGCLVIPGTFFSFYNLPTSLSEGLTHIEMSIAHYGNEFLFIVNATMITLGILSVFYNMQKYRVAHYIAPYVMWIGKNSLPILCIHGVVINIITKLMVYLSNVCGFHLFVTIITLAICFPIVQMLKKTMPNLLGIK